MKPTGPLNTMQDIDLTPQPARTNRSDEPSRQQVWQMFDRISHRYDLLNRTLSLGFDIAWRNRLARHLPERDNLTVLDLATGTADVLLTMDRKSGRVAHGLGIDMAGKMLEIGRQKIAEQGVDDRLRLVRADATLTPFHDRTFDAVSIAFGIRNLVSVPTGLSEMYRLLKPGGRALILEFSLPSNRLIRRIYLWYFRHVLPRLGGAVSGDSYAYQYLNKTVETFPYGEEFLHLMRNAGFQDTRAYPLTFGIATLYSGDRKED